MGIRFSDKLLMYSLASVFEMVSSPAFNVSMFIWPLPVAVPFFKSRSAASTSHDVMSGTSLGSPITIVVIIKFQEKLPSKKVDKLAKPFNPNILL